MAWKTIPIISQSSVKIISKKAIACDVLPSNSIYFNRYPYKVVFNLTFDQDKPWFDQIKLFECDLNDFISDILTAPVRKYMVTQSPSLFLQSYSDLKKTLAVYGEYISQVHGPTSKDHLELLYSKSFKCQSKDKLWYNMYDCKVEVWLPLRYRSIISRFTSNNIGVVQDDEEAQTSASLINYVKENINAHVPRHYLSRYTTTIYCKFDEFLEIYPFVKLSYPTYRIDITKAIVKT